MLTIIAVNIYTILITLHRLTTHTFLPWHSPRYLLDFGEVSTYLGYSALTDFFPRYEMRPNPQCSVGHCVAAQAAYQVTNYLTANVLVGPNSCCLGTGEHPFVHESHINYFAVWLPNQERLRLNPEVAKLKEEEPIVHGETFG